MTEALKEFFWLYGVCVACLCAIGVYCLIVTGNLIRAIIGLELITKGLTLLIGLAGYVTGNIALAQAYIITLIVIEVVVVVVAGGIIVSIFKTNGTIDIRVLRKLKG